MFLFFFLAILFFFNLSNSGELSNYSNHSRIDIVPSNQFLEYKKNFFFGIKIKLEDGWKTYWKNPGDAGAPISIQFDEEGGILDKEILFPFPRKFVEESITTIGYENEVIFPVKLTLEKNIKRIKTTLNIEYLVCREICIPVTKQQKIDHYVDESFDNFNKSPIFEYFQMVPTRNQKSFVVQNLFRENDFKISLTIKKPSAKKIQVFAYSDDATLNTEIEKKNNLFHIEINSDERLQDIKSPISIITSDNSVFEEIIVDVSKINEAKNFLTIKFLILALLGGIILNFMPCVLPVLSLKLLSLVKVAQNQKNLIKRNIISIVFGIFSSFIFIAFLIVFFKSIGQSVGWGFQFQNIYFLTTITFIIFLFSLNLLGFFEIILPNKIVSRIDKLANSSNVKSYFLSGVFATLMATPCSAPFLGTAIGFSSMTNSTNIVIIFTLIALGFSFPYLLILFNPKLLRLIPKPGKWMMSFKYILGLILLITSSWLMKLSGIDLTIIYFLNFLVMTLSILIFFNKKKIIICFLSFILLLEIISDKYQQQESKTIWTKFEKSTLEKLINEDKVILLDFTADWCITCQINKKTTLQNMSLLSFLKDRKVELMRGDWTKSDNEILSFIKSHGRIGIPVNIIYGPNNKNGIVLPEILTKDLIMDNIMLVLKDEYQIK